MADYDIAEAFQKIEEEMIASMSRNLKRHLKKELDEGINYSMWQAEQLAALNNFRKNNEKAFKSYFSTVNKQIETILKMAYQSGAMDQETRILEAIKKGWKVSNLPTSDALQGSFFKINERKLTALIEATTKDMAKAETAMLRMANDEYRKVIYNSEVYYNTGAGTLSQCVDMATKDFLSRGITCIEYANGARVAIDSYAQMALRTAQTRAYLTGEASMRDEWGVSTVRVNRNGVACPRCLRYIGQIFYDDVWGSAPIPSPPKYPRLSEAIAGGLYHPNCRDIHSTYFEDFSSPSKPLTEEEKKEAARVYDLEQKQRYNERMIRKYKRLSAGSTDPENVKKYEAKLSSWQEHQRDFVKANGDVLKRRYENEKLRLPATLPEPPKISGTVKQPRPTKDLTNIPKSDIMARDAKKADVKKPAPVDPKSSVVHGPAGSDLLSKEAKTKLQRSERILVGNNYETAMVFDTDGNVVFKKKGARDEVSFTASEIKQMKGRVVTHNHPNGSGFSADDIAMLRRSKAAELRACTRGGTYVIRPPQKWPDSLTTRADIDAELDRIFDDLGNKYRDIAAQEGSSIIRYLPIIEEETMQVFGQKYGFYTAFEDALDMKL